MKRFHRPVRLVTAICPLLITVSAWAADWPVADGPTGTNVAPLPVGIALIGKPAEARLLWKSADRIPRTYGTDARKCSAKRSEGADVGSGYCAPVVADERVFLYYHRSAGDAVDQGAVAKSLTNGGWGRTTWVVESDAVVHCFEARTGATLWQRVFPREGPQIDVGFNKGGGHFLCQVVDGRLYVFTNGGRLRCLDPATGDEVWQRGIGPRTLSLDLIRKRGVEDGAVQYFNRHLTDTPAIGGGIVAMSDGREDTGMRGQGGHGLTGFDAATGALKWYLAEGHGDTPAAWSHGGKDSFLCFGDKGLTCVDATTGMVRWNRPDIGSPGPALAIDGDRILASWKDASTSGKGAKPIMLCLQLSVDAPPKELWRAPGGIEHGNHAFAGTHVYHVDDTLGVRCLDAATGKVLATVPGWNPEFMGIVVTGDLLLGPERNGVHLIRLGNDGSLTDLGMILMPIATCTRIAVADGQMVVRCRTRLHCYDLLKH